MLKFYGEHLPACSFQTYTVKLHQLTIFLSMLNDFFVLVKITCVQDTILC